MMVIVLYAYGFPAPKFIAKCFVVYFINPPSFYTEKRKEKQNKHHKNKMNQDLE